MAKSAQGLERFAQGGIDLVLFGSVAARYAGDRVITRLKAHDTGFPPAILCSQRLLNPL